MVLVQFWPDLDPNFKQKCEKNRIRYRIAPSRTLYRQFYYFYNEKSFYKINWHKFGEQILQYKNTRIFLYYRIPVCVENDLLWSYGGTATVGRKNVGGFEYSQKTPGKQDPDPPKCITDLQPLSEECEEHGEVDWSRGLVHHGLQVILSGILHRSTKFTDIPMYR